MPESSSLPIWPLLAAALALLIPWGIALLAASALPAPLARQAALAPLAAFALAALGYFLCGFALHYGGIGLLFDHPDLDPLVWEWSALNESWGATWGMAGLAGFGLAGVRSPLVYFLFLSALPGATTAALLPLLALRGRTPAAISALFGVLAAAVGYPLLGNWTQGGGWLANLGFNIGFGHGFVDIGSSGLLILGGGVALAGMLSFLPRGKPTAGNLPPVYLPRLAMIGAGFILIGSTGWLLAWPLTDWTQIEAAALAVHTLLAAAGGGAAALAYTWLVAHRPDLLQGARGLAAGWAAGLAGAVFVPPGLALLIGFLAGLIMILTTYGVDHRLRLQDRGGLLATFGLPALWGVLAVGLWADGSTGAGFNRVGGETYLGVVGQGVTGLLPAVGWARDWPGQFLAQSTGAAALLLLGFFVTTLLAAPLSLLWQHWTRRMAAAPHRRRDRDVAANAAAHSHTTDLD